MDNLVRPGGEISRERTARRVPRHHHLAPCAAIVLRGWYVEAGDRGRFRLTGLAPRRLSPRAAFGPARAADRQQTKRKKAARRVPAFLSGRGFTRWGGKRSSQENQLYVPL